MNFKTKNIFLSPIKSIQAEAGVRGAISLAQGIPRFSPPPEIRSAAGRAIKSGLADFYGPPQGIAELRERISARHLLTERVFYDPEKEVLITAGAMQGMSAALATLLSPGDEVLIPSPSYPPFRGLLDVLGIRPVPLRLRELEWRLDVGEMRRAVTARTRGIILCHPNNPTGTVYTHEEIAEILRLARARDLWVFVDEVYRFFVDRGVVYPSLSEFGEERSRVVRLMSFSKAFSLSGWRIGYLLADAPVAREILKVHDMMLTASASLPAQYAALCALADFPELPQQFNRVLHDRRARMVRRLEKLKDFFVPNDPEGAYYFFPKLREAWDDAAFARELLEKAGVAVVPGSAFGPGGEGHLRFSFAAKEGEIDEAFNRLEKHLLERTLEPALGEVGINRGETC